jgi:hypothetical protein
MIPRLRFAAVLSALSFACASCSKRELSQAELSAHTYKLNIPHLNYRSSLSFDGHGNWSMKEETPPAPVREQKGTYTVRLNDSGIGIVVLSRVELWFDTLKESDTTSIMSEPYMGVHFELYADDAKNLAWFPEYGYVWVK